MEAEAEGVGDGGVVDVAGELRESTGAGEGAAVPTEVMASTCSLLRGG
jgi:hypothetical protein